MDSDDISSDLDPSISSLGSTVRDGVRETVDGVLWLDGVQEKQAKDLEKITKVKQTNSLSDGNFANNRYMVCTLPLVTCEHTKDWLYKQQEEKFLASLPKNALEEEINDSLGILGDDYLSADLFMQSSNQGDQEEAGIGTYDVVTVRRESRG